MNHETEESRMKRMRKADVEELKRATSPWINDHFENEEIQEFWDTPGDGVFAETPKEGVKALGFSFCRGIPKCIELAKKYPGLEGLKINDCYFDKERGIKVYGELGALTNLRFLMIRDSNPLDRETLRLIAGLPRLEGLVLAVQPIDSAENLKELGASQSLRALRIGVRDFSGEDGPWVEDLQFLSELPLLENLDLSDCRRVNLSNFILPPALKVFTVPNYTAAEVKRRFREKCAVIKGCTIHSPWPNRFVRKSPESEKTAANHSSPKIRKKVSVSIRVPVEYEGAVRDYLAQLQASGGGNEGRGKDRGRDGEN